MIKNKFKKSISIILTLLQIFVAFPCSAFQTTDSVDFSKTTKELKENNPTISKQGQCGENGDNVTWVLYSDGKLVISGSGDMANYNCGEEPWFADRDSINTIIINLGVTSIGTYAFFKCDSLNSVYISNTVTHIHSYAFCACTSLKSIDIPDSVTYIYHDPFIDCESLSSVNFYGAQEPAYESTRPPFAECSSNLNKINVFSKYNGDSFCGLPAHKNLCTISYDLQGGSLDSGHPNPTIFNIESDTVTLNIPTKEGYTFIGWTGSNGTTPETIVTIPKDSNENKSYTANWQLEIYNITYSLNGGKLNSGESNPDTYNMDSDNITLKTPSRKGYTFVGWTGSNGTTPETTVTILKGSTGNKHFTANWKLSRGAIAGISVGGVAGLSAIIVGTILTLRHFGIYPSNNEAIDA